MPVHIHARVQDADDFDTGRDFAIENDMPARAQAAIALSEIIARRAHLRAVGHEIYALFEVAQILCVLPSAPLALRVLTDPLEIGPRRRAQRYNRHL